jgi:hypothetical protein
MGFSFSEPRGGCTREALSSRLAGAVRWAGQPRLQWTTAQDARERDATRSHTAMRGNCTTEDEPGNVDYFMLVQPRESLALFRPFREGDRLNGDRAPAGIAQMTVEAEFNLLLSN